ncbi:MAG: ArsR/SmtB family transcription factor [Halosimplex sp.]
MDESTAQVSLRDVVVQDPAVSAAVDEPVRATILDMLADEPMTAGQVDAALTEQGFDRTENTIRHHINTLRDAGLVEVVRYEEGRGGTTKYYGATTLVLSYALPEGSDAAVEELVEALRPGVAALLDDLEAEHGETIDGIAAAMEPCDHCRTQKYETYVLLTVLRRAFARTR